MPKSHLYLLRSRYYIHRIDAAQRCRLLVPHEFANVTAPKGPPRQFMSHWKGSYYERKPEYGGFLIDRGSVLMDTAPLPLQPYIPAKPEATPC